MVYEYEGPEISLMQNLRYWRECSRSSLLILHTQILFPVNLGAQFNHLSVRSARCLAFQNLENPPRQLAHLEPISPFENAPRQVHSPT